jgi:predicted AAA+ superfamily ATPase
MYDRIFKLEKSSNSFIFGPRGTGKTSWLKKNFASCPYFDLLDDEVYFDLSKSSKNLQSRIPPNYKGAIIIDEVQKLPKLLDEVHRLIEENKKKYFFILTGSSARKLKQQGTNLLAGRAIVHNFYPLTAFEMGKDFSLLKATKHGMLPMAVEAKNSDAYLKSYINTYINLEVKLEGLTRDSMAFQKFLEAASFSQASPLNISSVASDCGIERRTVTNYFDILKDLLLSVELPLFSKRSKRELIKHRKFYFFDAGVFRLLRPQGPLDSDSEINGAVIETLVMQELRALNDYLKWNYELCYWHTTKHEEVDFVLYGKRGLYAIEVKSSARLRENDFSSLKLFKEEYKIAQLILLYGGDKKYHHEGIDVIPLNEFFKNSSSMF